MLLSTAPAYRTAWRCLTRPPLPLCAQFWVSQANKWCDACRVWMKDTAQSWAVHERGMKHQENVARSECRRLPAACPPWCPHWVCRSSLQ